MITAREELRARGGANRADVEPIEHRPLAADRVDVRRLDVQVSVDAQIAPTLIVREHHDDVRGSRRSLGTAERSAGNKTCEGNEESQRCHQSGSSFNGWRCWRLFSSWSAPDSSPAPEFA